VGRSPPCIATGTRRLRLDDYALISNIKLIDLMWGLSSIVLYYVNQKGTKTGEFMKFDLDGKVIRVVVNYSG